MATSLYISHSLLPTPNLARVPDEVPSRSSRILLATDPSCARGQIYCGHSSASSKFRILEQRHLVRKHTLKRLGNSPRCIQAVNCRGLQHPVLHRSCGSCKDWSLRRTNYGWMRAPGCLLGKSKLNLKDYSLAGHSTVTCAQRPNEPHAANLTCLPEEGLTMQESTEIMNTGIERDFDMEDLLRSRLPSHPKLHRGQLDNGLRYVILPNKVPPNR